jgi:thiamine biosynthesis protein ThiS
MASKIKGDEGSFIPFNLIKSGPSPIFCLKTLQTFNIKDTLRKRTKGGELGMIRVNGRTVQWTDEMTVASLLASQKYVFAKIIVKVNGTYVPKERYGETLIQNGDEVHAIHLLAGG